MNDLLANGLPARVAVIGCAGFIGSHLLEVLLVQGVQVTGWDLESSRIEYLLGHVGLDFRQRNYASAQDIQEIAESHKVVIHLAALCNPSLYNTQDVAVIESNYHHPSRLAQACQQQGTWLIYFSTSEVYGSTMLTETLQEDRSSMIYGPIGARRWSYANAKQMMERWIVALHAEKPFPWTVMRPFNFLGPRMDFIPGVDGFGLPRVMACFMEALMKGKPMQLVDGGHAKRAFTWIGDAVAAIVAVLKNPHQAHGQCFNVGHAGNEASIAELAEQMGVVWNEMRVQNPQLPMRAQPVVQQVSALEFYGTGYEDSRRRVPDTSKAEQLLGWKAEMGLPEILRQTMEWFALHYQSQVVKVSKT